MYGSKGRMVAFTLLIEFEICPNTLFWPKVTKLLQFSIVLELQTCSMFILAKRDVGVRESMISG